MSEPEHEHQSVEAKVVAVDPSIPPIDSVIVGDKRKQFGRRLGALALMLLLMFFAIAGYIQSSRNGEALNQASRDRSALIKTVNSQSELIKQLQDAIRLQNDKLRDAGIAIVAVPGSDRSTTTYLPSPEPEPEPSSSAHPQPRPSPKPSHKPSPSPTDTVKETICQLTGICTLFQSFMFIF